MTPSTEMSIRKTSPGKQKRLQLPSYQPQNLEELRELLQFVFPQSGFKSAQSKLAILEAYINCTYELGIFKVTFEAIALQAETSKTRVRYNFPNLDRMSLFAARYVNFIGRSLTRQRLHQAKTWMEKVDAFPLASFDFLRQFPHLQGLLNLFYYQASSDEEYRQLYRKIRDDGAERFIEILKENLYLSPENYLSLARKAQVIVFGSLVEASCRGQEADTRQSENYACLQVRELIAYGMKTSR